MTRTRTPTPNAEGGSPAGFSLAEAYARMRERLGHQGWWPGRTPFEVCLGAILTQNTSWTQVERTLQGLDAEGLLDPEALHALGEDALAERLRPSGTFRVKARRVRAFLDVLMHECHGSLTRLFSGDTASVRARLLAIHGIGPETADCLLLYAGGHPSFVIDAYTRRILSRHGACPPGTTYGELQAWCAASLPAAAGPGEDPLDRWQDCHAQLVAVAKRWCHARRPDCAGCPLRPLLPGGALPA